MALLHLTRNGFFGLIQQRTYVMRGGIRVYTETQGCDIVGNSITTGTALYVEVKAKEVKSLNFGPHGDVKSHQRDFLLARDREFCLALVAWYYQEKFYFINIRTMVDYMTENKRLSYPISEAVKSNLYP